jgi:PKD repeat protein
MRKHFTIALLTCSSFFAASAQCITPAWPYSQEVSTYNPNSTSLSDFQVLLTINTAALVSAGKMQADGDDIRFSDGSCCTQYCYAIESGMNTATTRIWVKVPGPMIPLTNTTFKMFYGNPSASAGANPNCTWDMWEPFDNSVNHFTASCGSGTYTVSGGSATISWGSNYVLTSDTDFPVGTVYTAEGNMLAASGNWPGINFSRNTPGSHFGYSILLGSGVRIAKAGSTATDYCRGENWASPVYSTPGSVVGLWSITWIATGSQRAVFPGLGTLTSTDTEHARSGDMKVCIGGISGGTGSMQLDWVRVRKYAANDPVSSFGSESLVSFASVGLGPDINACAGTTVLLDPGFFSSYLWSDASTDSSLSVTSSGSYWVQVTGGAGSCPGSDTVSVNFVAPIVLSLADSVSICPGDTALIDAGAGFSSYDWSNGETSSIAHGTTAGMLYVVVLDSIGCEGRDSVLIEELAAPVLSMADSVSGCAGDTFVLDAGAGFSSYLWSTGATTQTIAVGAGSYDVTVTNSAGCEASATVVASAAALPTATFSTAPGATASEVEFTAVATSGVTYAWDFGDGGTSTVANPVHTYSSDNSYNVCLTVTDIATGCSNTSCQTVVITAVNAPAIGSFQVYPNPATDLVQVEFSLPQTQELRVEVLDLRGVSLLSKSVVGASGALQLDVQHLAPAMYLLRISTEQGAQVVRLAVQ